MGVQLGLLRGRAQRKNGDNYITKSLSPNKAVVAKLRRSIDLKQRLRMRGAIPPILTRHAMMLKQLSTRRACIFVLL
jgi:hypothetical protein